MGKNEKGFSGIDLTNANFSEIMSDYTASKTTRFSRRRKIPMMGADADYHYRNEYEWLRLIEYARALDRNDAVIGQLADRAIDNKIQGGFKVEPKTGDETLDRDITNQWEELISDPRKCDSSQEKTFWELVRIASRHESIDGDIIALPLKDGSLQLIEAHRVRTPSNTKRNVVHGILLDEYRRKVQYWITKNNLNPREQISKVSDMIIIPAFDSEGNKQVFHVYKPKRISQTRGVSYLTPILDIANMFEDLNFANLVRAQMASVVAFLRERPMSASVIRGNKNARTTTSPNGTIRTIRDLTPGLEIVSAPGEKLTGFSPNVPNPEYFTHFDLLFTLLSINFGLPLVIGKLDASQTNFSGWRGAIDQARLSWRNDQRRIANQLVIPYYNFSLRRWASEDRVLAKALLKNNGFRKRVIYPKWRYIDPTKEATGEKIQKDNLLSSPRQISEERGQDYNDMIEEITIDNSKMIESAIIKKREFEKKYPEIQVDWREFIYGAAKLASHTKPEGKNGEI